MTRSHPNGSATCARDPTARKYTKNSHSKHWQNAQIHWNMLSMQQKVSQAERLPNTQTKVSLNDFGTKKKQKNRNKNTNSQNRRKPDLQTAPNLVAKFVFTLTIPCLLALTRILKQALSPEHTKHNTMVKLEASGGTSDKSHEDNSLI